MRFYSVLFLSACLTLSFISSACRSPRSNLEFSPAMAQTFETFIEKPADAANAKQYSEIEGYMMTTLTKHFAQQGLSARILTSPAEHKPSPNNKLLVIKLVSYSRVGYASSLVIQVTLKDGSSVLTSWQDTVQTSRPGVTLVNVLNQKIALNLKKYYAPSNSAPSRVPAAAQ
ncbi:MAG: hypothetical protein WCJ02_05775 [bacterium]